MVIARIMTEDGIRYAKVANGKYYLIDGDCYNIVSINTSAYQKPFVILAPVQPSKIIAMGANYHKHAKELNLNINADPTIFLKPPTAVIADGQNIIIPKGAIRVDYEAELAIVIGRDCRKVDKSDAQSVILGYTCANDVTERAYQKLDGQWTRAKGFDTFCPLGKYIVTNVDTSDLELKTIVNGAVVQRGRTSDMIHGIGDIIEFVSGVMSLNRGDIILTGTPDGIGQISEGDTVEIVIQNICSLKNKVVQEI